MRTPNGTVHKTGLTSTRSTYSLNSATSSFTTATPTVHFAICCNKALTLTATTSKACANYCSSWPKNDANDSRTMTLAASTTKLHKSCANLSAKNDKP